MDKNEFVEFLERFVVEGCVNVYFFMPNIDFPDGLRIMSTDMDYMELIEVGYASDCVIDVYMDHIGVNVHQWILEEQAEVYSSLDQLSGANEDHEEVHSRMDMDDGIDMQDLHGGRDDIQGAREHLQGKQDDRTLNLMSAFLRTRQKIMSF
ncbi:hypothetical protein Lser_V15G12361 [Lactuca serriola]